MLHLQTEGRHEVVLEATLRVTVGRYKRVCGRVGRRHSVGEGQVRLVKTSISFRRRWRTVHRGVVIT